MKTVEGFKKAINLVNSGLPEKVALKDTEANQPLKNLNCMV